MIFPTNCHDTCPIEDEKKSVIMEEIPIVISSQKVTKGRLISECIFEILSFPTKTTKRCNKFLP